jgi:CHAD domain-containing protein
VRRQSLPPTPRTRRFQQALDRRLEVLDRDLPAALRHDVEALHRTRVASRRLREVLPVIGAESAAGLSAGKSRGRIRRLTRALGGVRELDVALELLGELSADDPAIVAGAAVVRLDIERDRDERHSDMTRRLADLDPDKLTGDLEALTALRVAASPGEQRRRLRERLAKRSRALEQAVDAAGALYAFDRLHLVRIAVKKLRYVLELVNELAGVGTARLVRRLKEVQDLLGRLHDLEVLAGYARKARAGLPVGRDVEAGTAALVARIEQETRELHAEYLRRTPVLRTTTSTCQAATQDRLR